MIKRSLACAGVSVMALMTPNQAEARVTQAQATASSTAEQAARSTDATPPAGTAGVPPTAVPAETPEPQAAQTAPPPSPAGSADDIVVTGIRQSLERAAEVKKQAIQVVDSIVAQDIGKLPDSTTAAALQRVPGVQVSVNRNNELSDVRVRGLPDILTTVNGREVFTTTGRVFDLQDLPAEALARVDVFKSQTADLIDGGLAGTIDLQLNKPFSFRKPTAVLSARTNYGLRDKNFGPQVGLLLTDRWSTPIGDIGLLANGTYMRQNYTRAATLLVDRRSSQATPYNTPGLLLPNLLQNFPETGFIERKQVNAAAQWQASPAVQVYLEGFYTEFRDRGAHEGANAQPYTVSFGSNVVSLSNVVAGNQCFATRATAAGQNPAVLTAANGAQSLTANTQQQLCQPASATFNNIALNQTDQARDVSQRNKQIAGGIAYDQGGWKGDVDVAYQTSRNFTKGIIADVGQRLSSITATLDNDGSASFTTANTALISPDNLILRNSLQQQYTLATGNLFQAKADGQRDFESTFLKNLKVGVRYARRAADFQSVQLNTPVPAPAGTTGSPNFGTNEANVVRVSRLGLPSNFLTLSALAPDLNGGARFLVPNADFLLSDSSLNLLRPIFGLPLGQPAYDPGRQFDASEKTIAGYLQANYDIVLGNDLRLDGVAGARLTQTDRVFDGLQATAGSTTVFTPVHADTSEFDVLPSVTARLRVGNNFQARLGFQKSLRRPNFTDLNPALTLNTSFNPLVQSTASAGNPNLKEQKSDSYDGTLEYYFHGGYVALAGYYRNITNRVITSAAIETYNGIDYATARPRNVGQARLRGVEASGQYFLDFLPGGFSGIGTQGSFTFSDSKIQGNDPLAGLPLQGVSKYNFTAGLLYEKFGISGRLVYTFRSKYFADDVSGTTSVRPLDPALASQAFAPSPPLITYVRPAGRLDFNVGVDVSNAIRIDLGGTNILKNRTQSYYADGNLSRINYATQYDETTYTIGIRLRL